MGKILKQKSKAAIIAEKKEKLKKVEKFTPITNLSLQLDGERLNLNVLTKDSLLQLWVKLVSYSQAAKSIGKEDYLIGGFTIGSWIKDVQAKYEILEIREEEARLKVFENALAQKLSEAKRDELEIAKIAQEIGE